jgi:hypothetical protein
MAAPQKPSFDIRETLNADASGQEGGHGGNTAG